MRVDATRHITATCGLDAFVHCMEAYVTHLANPATDGFAHEGMVRPRHRLCPPPSPLPPVSCCVGEGGRCSCRSRGQFLLPLHVRACFVSSGFKGARWIS